MKKDIGFGYVSKDEVVYFNVELFVIFLVVVRFFVFGVFMVVMFVEFVEIYESFFVFRILRRDFFVVFSFERVV